MSIRDELADGIERAARERFGDRQTTPAERFSEALAAYLDSKAEEDIIGRERPDFGPSQGDSPSASDVLEGLRRAVADNPRPDLTTKE